MIFARLEARAYFPCILPIVCRFVIRKSSHIFNGLHSQRLVKCAFQPQCSRGPPLSRELTREKHERLFIGVEPWPLWVGETIKDGPSTQEGPWNLGNLRCAL
jgi:hypothetical protein